MRIALHLLLIVNNGKSDLQQLHRVNIDIGAHLDKNWHENLRLEIAPPYAP